MVTSPLRPASDPPVAPRQPGPSLRPALIVLGAGALIFVVGTAIALLGGRTAQTTTVEGLGQPVPGAKLRAVPARSVLAHIEASGQPPANIVAALTVPAGSRYLGAGGSSAALDQFDRSVRLDVGAPGSEVVHFYEVELSRAHWVLATDRSSGPGIHELLGQQAGSDGYQWLVGITITDQSPAVAPALAGGGQSAASCTVEIRLEQQGDMS